MKMRWMRMLTVLLTVVWLVAPGGADDAALRKEFQAIYKNAEKVWNEMDLLGIMAQFTPDWTYKQGNGTTLNFDQAAADFNRGFGSIKSMGQGSMRLLHLSRRGEEVVATVVGRQPAVIFDPQHNVHRSLWVETVREIWRKTPAGWRCRRSETLKVEMTLDGKRVDPFNPFGPQKQK